MEVRREVKLERAKSADKMRAVAEEQMAKSGDTIFRVQSVEVTGAEWFAIAKLLAEVRREALSLLAAMRYERNKPTPRILEDDGTAQYPIKRLSAEHNVVNSLARRFYQRHGVEHIVDGLDLLGIDLRRESYGVELLYSPRDWRVPKAGLSAP